MKKLLATLVTLVMIVSSLAVLTSCSAGKDGLTPTIGENGNWFIGEEDTGVPATGPKGDKGDKGDQGFAGYDGEDGANGADGADGATPTFRLNDGVLEVSYDLGVTWTEVPVVEGGADSGPLTHPGLLDDSADSFSYPMNLLAPVEGAIPPVSRNPEQLYTDEDGAMIVFIKIEGTVFDQIVLTLGTVDGGWTAFWFLTEMPTKGEPVSYAGEQNDRHDVSGAGRDTNPVNIPEDAKYLAIYYSDPGLVYCPTAITFQKAAPAVIE